MIHRCLFFDTKKDSVCMRILIEIFIQLFLLLKEMGEYELSVIYKSIKQ